MLTLWMNMKLYGKVPFRIVRWDTVKWQPSRFSCICSVGRHQKSNSINNFDASKRRRAKLNSSLIKNVLFQFREVVIVLLKVNRLRSPKTDGRRSGESRERLHPDAHTHERTLVVWKLNIKCPFTWLSRSERILHIWGKGERNEIYHLHNHDVY